MPTRCTQLTVLGITGKFKFSIITVMMSQPVSENLLKDALEATWEAASHYVIDSKQAESFYF